MPKLTFGPCGRILGRGCDRFYVDEEIFQSGSSSPPDRTNVSPISSTEAGLNDPPAAESRPCRRRIRPPGFQEAGERNGAAPIDAQDT